MNKSELQQVLTWCFSDIARIEHDKVKQQTELKITINQVIPQEKHDLIFIDVERDEYFYTYHYALNKETGKISRVMIE